MPARPAHLGPKYGEQFQDASVAAAYRTRPPYPAALDLGCGTGRIAIPLSAYVSRVDAVDPSAAMLEAAKAAGGRVDNIRWINESAETYAYSDSYGLIVTAASLHSFHSRNGFSRERMSQDSARTFDAAVRQAVRPFIQNSLVRTQVMAAVTWGVPPPKTREVDAA